MNLQGMFAKKAASLTLFACYSKIFARLLEIVPQPFYLR